MFRGRRRKTCWLQTRRSVSTRQPDVFPPLPSPSLAGGSEGAERQGGDAQYVASTWSLCPFPRERSDSAALNQVLRCTVCVCVWPGGTRMVHTPCCTCKSAGVEGRVKLVPGAWCGQSSCLAVPVFWATVRVFK